MDEFTLVGYERVDYTNKEGKRILGHRLHLSYVSDRVEGIAVQSEFISDKVKLPSPLPLKSKIQLLYNRFGRVGSVNLV